ncbi:MAG: DNA polymerase III subunit beta [Roseiarcus sp.]|jgi:DNA polymerase-3 subunit beta
MRFVASVKPLLAALAPAAKIAPTRATIPILANVKIIALDGGITFIANDLDKALSARAEAKVEREGVVTAPAHTLTDILRKFAPDGEASIELTDGALVVRSGRSRFTLPTLPAEDFPDFDQTPATHEFTMPAAALTALIDSVSYAISTEETRYYLNGIFLEASADPERLRAVATNGHVLALRDVALPAGAAGMPGIIVPRLACVEIGRLCAGVAEGGEVKVALSSAKLRVKASDVALSSRLIDGTFPEYRRVIPANPNAVALDRDAFAAAIERVSVVSDVRGRAVKLSFADRALTLTTTNPDSGSARDEIDLESDAPAIEIGFSARYLLDTLGPLPNPTLTIDLDSAGSPTVFRDRYRPDQLAVIMPVRV